MSLFPSVTSPYEVKSCLGKKLGLDRIINVIKTDLKTSPLLKKYGMSDYPTLYLDCQDNCEQPYNILQNLYKSALENIEKNLRYDDYLKVPDKTSQEVEISKTQENKATSTRDTASTTKPCESKASEISGSTFLSLFGFGSKTEASSKKKCECKEKYEKQQETKVENKRLFNSPITSDHRYKHDSEHPDDIRGCFCTRGGKPKQGKIPSRNTDMSQLKSNELCKCCKRLLPNYEEYSFGPYREEFKVKKVVSSNKTSLKKSSEHIGGRCDKKTCYYGAKLSKSDSDVHNKHTSFDLKLDKDLFKQKDAKEKQASCSLKTNKADKSSVTVSTTYDYENDSLKNNSEKLNDSKPTTASKATMYDMKVDQATMYDTNEDKTNDKDKTTIDVGDKDKIDSIVDTKGKAEDNPEVKMDVKDDTVNDNAVSKVTVKDDKIDGKVDDKINNPLDSTAKVTDIVEDTSIKDIKSKTDSAAKPDNLDNTIESNLSNADICSIFSICCTVDKKEFEAKLREELKRHVPDCECEYHQKHKDDINDENSESSFNEFIRELMNKLPPCDGCLEEPAEEVMCKLCQVCPVNE